MTANLQDMIDALNQLANGMIVLTNPSAYNPATTYNFPDLVAYTDGYVYMCLGTGVVGEAPPDYPASWKLQAMIPTIDSRQAVDLTGLGSVVIDGFVYDVFDIHSASQNVNIEIGLTEGRTVTLFFRDISTYTTAFQVRNVTTDTLATIYWMNGEAFQPSPTGMSSLTVTLFSPSIAMMSYKTEFNSPYL